jgi:hypothetical protein
MTMLVGVLGAVVEVVLDVVEVGAVDTAASDLAMGRNGS